MVILLAYVDDLAMFGDSNLINVVKAKLCECFDINDMGKLRFFLGVSIDECDDGVFISQKSLVQPVIQPEYGFL